MTLLLELFWTFFKIGLFTFGGGYAMLPLIEQQMVGHGWLTAAEIVDFIAVSESTPGPIAINMATFVGSTLSGFWGAVCATFGVVLPSFLVILIVARCYDAFRKNFVVKGCMSGLKPAVVGLIAGTVLSIGAMVFAPLGWSAALLRDPWTWASLGIFAIGLFLTMKKKLHPILVICLSAVLGIAVGYIL